MLNIMLLEVVRGTQNQYLSTGIIYPSIRPRDLTLISCFTHATFVISHLEHNGRITKLI